MAITLSNLISNIRLTLSDVPTEFLTNKQILYELTKAQAYCDAIVDDATTEAYLTKCYEVLATYYCYINYTTLSERQLGTLPPTSKIRLDALRTVAISFLQLVSKYPLNEDLMIDLEFMRDSTCAQIAMTPTVLEYDD